MDFGKISNILQIIQGVAALLQQVFANVQGNAPTSTGIQPHVDALHVTVAALNPTTTATSRTSN